MLFHLPVTVYLEEHCVRCHQAELAALGKKALIVTGRHSAERCGALEDVTYALKSAGIPFVRFSQVEENPSVETICKARDFGRENGVDFVIAIGGGSPLDAAKAIALLLKHPEQGSDFLYVKPASGDALPVVAVPTTCGTGSEVTGYSVLTVHEKRTKMTMTHRVFPTLALIDPIYLKAAPLQLLRNTAMDALGHLLESGLHSAATAFSRIFVQEGLSLWRKNKDVLLGKRTPTTEDFSHLMLSSTFAGMAISHTGTSLPHGLSYCLTYELGMPHGKAVGYFLSGYLREAPKDMAQPLLDAAGFSSAEALDDFYQAVCGAKEVPVSILEKSVDALTQNTAKQKCCPYPLSPEILRRIAGLT
ncbi:MAG: iron-containing alcohol dehydrogenase family protein [Oscillospiraceae bacterium]|nr:iron-containing alcohol dehydrogenase family protein [Oscillospiraceae bacterium]